MKSPSLGVEAFKWTHCRATVRPRLPMPRAKPETAAEGPMKRKLEQGSTPSAKVLNTGKGVKGAVPPEPKTGKGAVKGDKKTMAPRLNVLFIFSSFLLKLTFQPISCLS